jgi:hypothetical protein
MRVRSAATLALTLVFVVTTVPAAGDDTKAPDGFVSLFNGRDLAGWKTHPDDTAKWEVKDGAITASGKAGHLFSERGDYQDFVYRVEAKINDRGNSGQFFRTRFEKSFPKGYEAQINVTQQDTIKTGSLYPSFLRDREAAREFREKYTVKQAPHKVDEWFTQEVTAEGNRIVIKVNGKTTVEYTDPNSSFSKGHFAIQHHDPTCKVMVRKIEVKELPAKR